MKVGNLCIRCKGSRKLCGNDFCPILSEKSMMQSIDPNELKQFSGSSPPNVFIGSYGYPKVSVSPLVAQGSSDSSMHGEPERWIGKDYRQIIGLRMALLRARMGKSRVTEVDDTLLLDMSVAKRSVDTEVESRSLRFRTEFSSHFQPMGPLIDVKRIELTSNPQPDPRIEGVVYDELRAEEAVGALYSKGVNVSRISQVLSAGQLGIERKLVPTRWSITATDDMLGKSLVSRIKGLEQIDDFRVFETEAIGNHYVVLLFPHSFCFELMEAWFRGSLWAAETTVVSDYELHEGRKDYASNVTGSYYAARLAVAEYLESVRKQAGCIIFREVKSSYIVPLGVWQVRENMRRAMESHTSFNSMDDALSHCWSRLNIPAERWAANSKVLDFVRTQSKLTSFIRAAQRPPSPS